METKAEVIKKFRKIFTLYPLEKLLLANSSLSEVVKIEEFNYQVTIAETNKEISSEFDISFLSGSEVIDISGEYKK